MKLILLSIGLFAMFCNAMYKANASKPASEYKLNCQEVRRDGFADWTIERCENREVVCYTRHNGGTDCKFKGNKHD